MKLAIIILSQGNPEQTLSCLASLAAEVDGSVKAIVVDNPAESGSARAIEHAILARGWKTWAKLVPAKVDGGFAAAHNLGIRSEHAGAYLLLDPETRFEPGAIGALRAALERWGDAGIIGPCLLDGGGVTARKSLRALAPASALFRVNQRARAGTQVHRPRARFDALLPAPQQAIEPDWPARASVLIRRAVIDQIGMLDEGYSMFFEDIAYCRKVRAAGFRIMYFPHLDETPARISRSAWLVRGMSQLGRCMAWVQTRVGNASPRPIDERAAPDLQRNAPTIPAGQPAHLHVDELQPPAPIFGSITPQLPFGAMRLQYLWRAGESN